LPDEDKSTFRSLLGQHLKAEQLLSTLGALPLIEQERVVRMLDQGLVRIVMTKLILSAIRKARQHPEAKEEELAQLVEEEEVKYLSDLKRFAEAEVKKSRDRKSSPETIRRNVEICDKRRSDKKKWSYGRLAKDYKMTRQAIERIVTEEEKWRRLAAELSTN
jgi:hypothetical protein